MTSERIKEIQKGTTAPDSLSLQKALMQVWNEVQQEFEQQLKEKDEALSDANDTIHDLSEMVNGRDERIAELQEILSWKTEVINNFDKERKELRTKLKRYENPVAEFEANAYEEENGQCPTLNHISLDGTNYDIYLEDHGNTPTLKIGKKYRVIVLEGGE